MLTAIAVLAQQTVLPSSRLVTWRARSSNHVTLRRGDHAIRCLCAHNNLSAHFYAVCTDDDRFIDTG